MFHMKESWSEEMQNIKKVVSQGDAKVLTQHVVDMLAERNMNILDLALVITSGEIILGLDEYEKCTEAYIKNQPGMHRLVLGKNSTGEDVVVAIEVTYKESVLVVEKIITIYSLDEDLNKYDPRLQRKLEIREFLKSLLGPNHESNDALYTDEQGRRVYFLEDGTPYVVGKDGRLLTRFKGYKGWMGFNLKKSS